MLAMSLYQT